MVRYVLRVKTRMIAFKNKSVHGQWSSTQSRTVIDQIHERVRAAAEKYQAARCAKYVLAGEGEWEKVLRILNNNDIHGYQDPNRLHVRVGRRGTLEDGQVAAAADVGPDDNIAEDVLWNEPHEWWDRTGETRRTLSWIWTTESHSRNPEDDGDNILWVEWAKSRAWASRCQEEVLLLREEMQRVLAFLKWKSSWWLARKNSRTNVASDYIEGLQAYAETQSDLQQSLGANFCNIWKSPLARAGHALDDNGNSDANRKAGDDDGDDDDDDDDNDDDDGNGDGNEGRLAEGSDQEGSDADDG